MEPAGVSGTGTISDQRSYINIETLRGKSPTDIHGALSEVFGEFTVDYSTVSHWANLFCGGYVSVDIDPRPERPRTSTNERSVKLVADALEEDRRATCEELSGATGGKTSQENLRELTSVARGWPIHSPGQCSPAHRGCCNKRTSQLWVRKVTSCVLQSRHESTRL